MKLKLTSQIENNLCLSLRQKNHFPSRNLPKIDKSDILTLDSDKHQFIKI